MRRIVEAIICLAISGAAGTMAATTITCGVGRLNGTDTWCGVGFIWIVAIPVSVLVALLLGGPLAMAFNRLKIEAWWQYGLAGFAASLPVWAALSQPFESARWQSDGPYDTLNYVGSGVLSAMAYWFLAKHVSPRSAA